ncbi:MAG: carbohydrate-binding domain-containing protein [Lachnospiraceae bacterium]|nr:carbohydrate-binding domain-containing protein [Lachnospiraceae bacterium]
MRMNKCIRLIAVTVITTMMVSGCGLSESNNKDDSVKSDSDNNHVSIRGNGSIYLNEDSVSVEGVGIDVDGTTITILSGGEYTFKGSLKSGQVVVDADSDVTLILNGMSITNEKEDTLYIKNGDVTVKLMENTENTITSGSEKTTEKDSEDSEASKDSEDSEGAAIFAKDDLYINGTGKLNVNGHINNGIQSKDKMYIEGGEINVVSLNDGIKGKEGVYASGGNISITSGGDGIQSNADMDISGGNINITAGGGAKELNISEQKEKPEMGEMPENGETQENGERPEMREMPENGETPENGERPEMGEMPENGEKPEMGEMPENGEKPEMGEMPENGEKPEMREFPKDGEGWKQGADNDTNDTDDVSTKGIKADGSISISDGSFTIDSLDDSIHSNKKIEISGGEFLVNTDDDGIHADEELSIKSGYIKIEKCNEGLEAVKIDVDGGEINIKSSDDGINANGGNNNFGGKFKKDFGENESSNSDKSNSDKLDSDKSEEETPVITINEGVIYIDAEGDGIDSNGSIYIKGGDIIVNGSSNGGNSAIDYGSENGGGCTVSGGKIIATGYSDMAESFDSAGSEQCSILYIFETELPVGTEIMITDENDKNVMSYTTVKKCDSVIFSSSELEINKTYTVTAGEQSGTIAITENAVSNKTAGGRRMGKRTLPFA